MSVIQYVKEDWTIVLPYRLRHNRYRGASRPSYALLCLLYYSIKSFLILYFYGAFKVYKFMLWDIWKWLWGRVKSMNQPHSDDSSQPYDEQIKEEEVDKDEEKEEEEVVEEFPFCQIFRLGEDEDLHIMRVEYCPDETAFIRVVSDDSYTRPYKRKVQRDKQGKRFILFDNERFYLDPKRTQPRMPE